MLTKLLSWLWVFVSWGDWFLDSIKYAVFGRPCGTVNGIGHTLSTFGVVLANATALAIAFYGLSPPEFYSTDLLPFYLIALAVIGCQIGIIVAPHNNRTRIFNRGTVMYTWWTVAWTFIFGLGMPILATHGALPGQLTDSVRSVGLEQGTNRIGVRVEVVISEETLKQYQDGLVVMAMSNECREKYHAHILFKDGAGELSNFAQPLDYSYQKFRPQNKQGPRIIGIQVDQDSLDPAKSYTLLLTFVPREIYGGDDELAFSDDIFLDNKSTEIAKFKENKYYRILK